MPASNTLQSLLSAPSLRCLENIHGRKFSLPWHETFPLSGQIVIAWTLRVAVNQRLLRSGVHPDGPLTFNKSPSSLVPGEFELQILLQRRLFMSTKVMIALINPRPELRWALFLALLWIHIILDRYPYGLFTLLFGPKLISATHIPHLHYCLHFLASHPLISNSVR